MPLELTENNIVPSAMIWGLVGEGAEGCLLTQQRTFKVFRVRDGQKSVIIKQALTKSRDASLLRMDQKSFNKMVSAQRFFGQVLGTDCVPEVLFEDAESLTVAMASAPEKAVPWRDLLLQGMVDPRLGSRAAECLKWMQDVSPNDPSIPAEFWESQKFEEEWLHINILLVRKQNPSLAGPLEELYQDLSVLREGVVHGSFTPDNILVADGKLTIIDFELAHIGSLSFDIASLLSRLVLAIIHRPTLSGPIRDTVQAFVDFYGELPVGSMAYLGGLILVSVDGLEPEPFLNPSQQEWARKMGTWILKKEIKSLVHLFDNLDALLPK